jgi:hypothetical protein
MAPRIRSGTGFSSESVNQLGHWIASFETVPQRIEQRGFKSTPIPAEGAVSQLREQHISKLMSLQ